MAASSRAGPSCPTFGVHALAGCQYSLASHQTPPTQAPASELSNKARCRILQPYEYLCMSDESVPLNCCIPLWLVLLFSFRLNLSVSVTCLISNTHTVASVWERYRSMLCRTGPRKFWNPLPMTSRICHNTWCRGMERRPAGSRHSCAVTRCLYTAPHDISVLAIIPRHCHLTYKLCIRLRHLREPSNNFII